ncbi:MAG: hypothetical protein JNJ71_00075 [Rubrivivax sp.]|nr:hypothetical protein [Rubrivivax sp.]
MVDAASPHPIDPWPGCGWAALQRLDSGWLRPTPAWWQRWLQRPELLPPPEACAAERGLHHRLIKDPLRAVAEHEWRAIEDEDARENWRHWLHFRDAVQAAGSLEAWYLQLMRRGRIDLPPLFIDGVVQALVRGLLDGVDDAFELRAAELLFRVQRITSHEGARLAGDRDTLDLLNETGGYGELGRLLAQAQAPLRRADLRVLTPENAPACLASACADPPRFDTLLDLRHELTQELGHGLQFRLAHAQSGLKGLSRILERWTWHLLGVRVQIRPESRIDDERWRWHIGLDVSATALLNDLYEGREVGETRQRALISLFRLSFEDPQELRADLREPAGAARPIYLGLAQTGDGLLRLKPQNLLLNLPLARAG